MKITLIENFRAMFYTPFYATEALGAYAAEGLEVEMRTSAASAQTLGALVSGAGEVSWGGPMRIMLARDADPQAGAVAFCEVVGRDPFFLIGRSPNANFRMSDLLGRRIATVSEVPTPWICLKHDLRGAGIDPAALTRTPERAMAANAESLRAGEIDVIQVFHPLAKTLVDEGAGHLWYAAADRGLASYTTLNTTRAYVERSPETLLSMTRAIYRTQKWIAAHDGHALAQLIAPYLPDIPTDVLAACCEDYKSRGVWNITPVVQRAGLEWKREAMAACGAIARPLAYEDYVATRFAEEVVREDPPAL
jgi:NitT/TauT family transport system substrate-binding protein